MIDIFRQMQQEATEHRRLAEYFSPDSDIYITHIKEAEKIEEQVKIGIKTMSKIFGNYSECPTETHSRKSCACHEDEANCCNSEKCDGKCG